MPTTLQLAAGDPDLLAATQRARRLLNRRALASAAASAVPVPGLDWLVDAAMLAKLLPAINEEFGLTPDQLDRLPRRKREQVEKAVGVVGSMVIGKFITRDLVIKVAAAAGKRMTIKQATRYVPLAGQALSALIGYTAIRYLGEQHIRDCVQVCKAADLQLPAPAPAPEPQPAIAPPRRLAGRFWPTRKT
ncbi:hypothetical protein [Ramlibacter sp.]|uniref:hypothetical protein n=1 Tax=Ramlibacter sp. TaxID=1917967 RepID=UPI00262E58B3|nr:hypothetical protein [Ramlibacter sp.]